MSMSINPYFEIYQILRNTYNPKKYLDTQKNRIIGTFEKFFYELRFWGLMCENDLRHKYEIMILCMRYSHNLFMGVITVTIVSILLCNSIFEVLCV